MWLCLSLLTPRGGDTHIPAVDFRGHRHVSGIMWSRIQALGAARPSPMCTLRSTCSAHSSCDGLPRQPGRWRHARCWTSEEGQAWRWGAPGDELLGKEPGPPEKLPFVYAALAAASLLRNLL